MICRCAQELLGNQFTVIHIPDCMMANVDALIRHFRSLLAKQVAIVAMLRDRDQLQRPKSYVSEAFLASNNSKIQYIQHISLILVLTKYFISEFTVPPSNKPNAYT